MEAVYKRIEGEVASVAPPVSRPCNRSLPGIAPVHPQLTHNSPAVHGCRQAACAKVQVARSAIQSRRSGGCRTVVLTTGGARRTHRAAIHPNLTQGVKHDAQKAFGT